MLQWTWGKGQVPWTVSAFWQQVLGTHQQALKLTQGEYQQGADLRQQVIFYHEAMMHTTKSRSGPTRNRDIEYDAELREVGLDRLGGWVDLEGHLRTCQEILTRVPKRTWLWWRGMVDRIPKQWLTQIQEARAQQSMDHPREPMTKQVLKKRWLEDCRGHRAMMGPFKWDWGDWRLNFTPKHWEQQFQQIRNITRESRLQVFQYKVCHRILACGSRLFKQKIRETPFCNICKNTDETIEHMFLECPQVKDIWTKLKGFHQEHTGQEILQTDLYNCIFIDPSKEVETQQWNYLALIT